MKVGVEILPNETDDPVAVTDVTEMVGLAGELCGVLSLRCSAACGATIASKMLGVPASEAAANISDAIGEICNMVAGDFKAKIDRLRDECMLSVPTVITGGDYQLQVLVEGERIDLPFLLEEESMWIGLEVRG